MKNLLEKLIQKIKKNIDIIIFLLLLFFLRIPCIFEPHWDTTESFAAVTGQQLALKQIQLSEIPHEVSIGTALLYEILFKFNLSPLFFSKIINLFAIIISLFSLFFILKIVFNRFVAQFASLLFIFFIGIPFFNSNVVSTQVLFLGAFLFSLLLLICKKIFISSLGTVISVFSIILSPIQISFLFPITIFLSYKVLKLKNNYKKIILITSFLFALAGLFWFLKYNKLIPIFFNEISYFKDSEFRHFNDSIGFWICPNTYLTRLIITIIIIAITLVFLKLKNINKETFLVILFTIFSTFNLLAAKYADPHLLIITVTSLITTFSSFLSKDFFEKDLKRLIMFFAFSILIFISVLNLFSSGRKIKKNFDNSLYYLNTFKYVSGKINTNTYINFYSKEIGEIYKINNYIIQIYDKNTSLFAPIKNKWIYIISSKKYSFDFVKENNLNSNSKKLLDKKPNLVLVSKDDFEKNAEIFLNKYEIDMQTENFILLHLNN